MANKYNAKKIEIDGQLLLEMLCDFNCTHALDSDEENAIDVVSKVLEDWKC